MKNFLFSWKRKDIDFLLSFFAVLFAPIMASLMMHGIDDEGGGTPVTEKELKTIIADEITDLSKGLKNFVNKDDMLKEVKAIADKVEELNIKGMVDQIEKLEEAAEAQGLEMKKLQDRGANEKKSLQQIVTEKAESLSKMITDKHSSTEMSVSKDVLSTSFTNDRAYFSEPGVRELQRGLPWVRDLFNVVTLGPGTHGSIDWWEQLALTNNASMVAEGGSSASKSDLTWTRKTLDDKILHDWVKVSKDRLKDVDFVAGELNTLINRNMRLLENSQLLSGTGAGNNIKGVTGYAQTFTTAGISISSANLSDLIGKIKTQIRVDSLDGFMPNAYACNSELVDLVRYLKDEFGQYVFPAWAQGAPVTMQGLMSVENNLIADNSLLVGDFTLGTVYEWDSLLVEVGFINDDFTKGMVTINARMRENLRIKDNDVKGFVYVNDVATAIENITEVIG